MLISDMRKIGNKILEIRKRTGWTQAEIAEKAGIADRSYADIERGNVNMRVETLLKICEALNITPDDILTEEKKTIHIKQGEVAEKFANCSEIEKQTALAIIDVYLRSVKK